MLDAPLFSAGSKPLQTVTALLKRRNDLVHPRPRDVDFTGEDSFAAALLAECDTQTAAGYIVAVAEVTVRLAGAWAERLGAVRRRTSHPRQRG